MNIDGGALSISCIILFFGIIMITVSVLGFNCYKSCYSNNDSKSASRGFIIFCIVCGVIISLIGLGMSAMAFNGGSNIF